MSSQARLDIIATKEKRRSKVAVLTMKLSSVNDLLLVDRRISEITEEREDLAAQLEKAYHCIDKNTSCIKKYESIADEVIRNGKSLEEIQVLKSKYGNLQVLLKLEQLYEEQETVHTALNELNQLDEEVRNLSELEDSAWTLELLTSLSTKLKQTKLKLADTTYSHSVYEIFDNEIVDKKAKALSIELNELLLESRWDTPSFVPVSGNTIGKLRKASTRLYKLAQLSVTKESLPLWNFKCLANNFNIRFTYHFHDDSFKIEMYFKFLNDYLTQNLHKCISIFHDEANGLTKQIIHEEFINHVLQPIRDKVECSLSLKDGINLISLISQIISTDKNLSNSFHYHGMGLISLVPAEIWNTWLDYEVENATKQFQKITSGTQDISKSALDFVKLLNKMYDYLEPFYGLQYEFLRRYKLLTCSHIFINLSSLYLDYLLALDTLREHRTEEEELYQTLLKLQNLNVVYQRISELSQEYIFVHLTDVVNERESKKYHSLFQNVQNDYRRIIEESIQPSIIHRIKKILKESLRNYFKIGTWTSSNNQNPESTNAELVNSIKLLSRIVLRIDSLGIPLEVTLGIKSELLNIIVNYFIESILKLNKFDQQGLNQFKIDFQAMRGSLNLSIEASNAQESILLEILKVLFLKYDQNKQDYFKTSYIKNAQFDDLKSYLSIKLLKDSEIQDALYRIAYGSIL